MTQFDKKGDTAEFDINEFLSNACIRNVSPTRRSSEANFILYKLDYYGIIYFNT